MLYSTIVQRDETGFNSIYNKAREFEMENALEAIIACKFNLRKVEKVLSLVRIYHNTLNIESSELVEFSENFIEQYATDNNKCFEIALKLVKKIGKTITGSMKLFRQFCPVVRRKLEKGLVVPTLDYTKLTHRLYHSDFFGSEVYEERVKTLLQEMANFFYHLVTTMKVCKDMIQKEQEVKGDYARLKEIFEKSCDEVLRSVNEVNATFKNVQLVTPEELEERKKNARPMKEWLAEDYHAHDKQWLRREGYIRRVISGAEEGLDETASNFWPHNPKWGAYVIEVVKNLDKLGLGFKKTKTEGKLGKFDAREMVYLIKWSGVSYVDENGKLVNEEKERRFYTYILNNIYKGNYELPSWQAVCRERKFCYDEKMSHEELVNAFAAHLPKEDSEAGKATLVDLTHKEAI